MVEVLSSTVGGIRIGETTLNVYCYADDILLSSLTDSGLQIVKHLHLLQRLINTATSYIETHGLRFNPSKTTCVMFGPNTLTPQPKWELGEKIEQAETVNYMRVTLGNSSKPHVDKRIAKCRNAFYSLEGSEIYVHQI